MSKQILGILEELDYANKEPVLVKCLAVHNEAEWLEANLKNCYDEFDIIRVVEGAVVGRPHSTDDGHSTDDTLKILRSFPDVDNKIELYTQDRFFKSLEEQKQTFLDVANEGEWLFIVDCDEFYMDGDIDRVRQAIKKRPAASEFVPVFLHFYRDFKHLKAPHPEWQMQHQRIIRYRDGLRYHTHPVATDDAGKCTYFAAEYQRKRFTLPDVYIYHYGHAKGEEFHRMKQEFYKSELEKFKTEDGQSAFDKFDQKLFEFVNRTEEPSTILEFDAEHPCAIRELPQYSHVDKVYADQEFLNWKDNFVYAAEKLPNIALYMMGPWQNSEPFYNVMEC